MMPKSDGKKFIGSVLLALCILLTLSWGCAKEESCAPVDTVKIADDLLVNGGIEDANIRSKAQSLYNKALDCSPPAEQTDVEFVQSHAHFGLGFISIFNTTLLLQQALAFGAPPQSGTSSTECTPLNLNAVGPGGLSIRELIIPIFKSTIDPLIKNLEEAAKYQSLFVRYTRANLKILDKTATLPEVSFNLAGSFDRGEAYFFLGLFKIIEGGLDTLFAYDGLFDTLIGALTCPQKITNPLLDPSFGRLAANGPDLLLAAQALLGGGFDAWAKGIEATLQRRNDSFADGWVKNQQTGLWQYTSSKVNGACDGCVGDKDSPGYTGEYYVDRNGNGQYDDPTEHYFYFKDWGLPQGQQTITLSLGSSSVTFTVPASYPSPREPDGFPTTQVKTPSVWSPNPSEWNLDPTGDNHPCSLQQLADGTPCGERDGVRQKDISGANYIEDPGWETRNKPRLFLGVTPIVSSAGPDDTGPDGLHDVDEPGYDPDCNPDPSNDDYKMSHLYYTWFFGGTPPALAFGSACMFEKGAQNCFEGDGVWEPGEPFRDYGTDNVPDMREAGYKGPDPEGDDYDPVTNPRGTENNGRYDRGEPWGSPLLTRLIVLVLRLNPSLMDLLGLGDLKSILTSPQIEPLVGAFLDQNIAPLLSALVPLDFLETTFDALSQATQGTKPLDITPAIALTAPQISKYFSGLFESLLGPSMGPMLAEFFGSITPMVSYAMLNLPAFDLSILFTRHVDDLKSLLPLYYTEDEPYTDANVNGKYDPPEPLADGWFSAPTSGWYQFPNLQNGVCFSCSSATSAFFPCTMDSTKCFGFVFNPADPLYEGSWYNDVNTNGQWDPGEPFSSGTIHVPTAGWQNMRALVNGKYDIGTCYAECTPLTATTITTSPTYVGEWYQDLNQNGQWDPGETFQDVNADGQWNAAGTLIAQSESEQAFHPRGKKCGSATLYCPDDPYSDTGVDRLADNMETGYSPANLDPARDNVVCNINQIDPAGNGCSTNADCPAGYMCQTSTNLCVISPYVPFPISCGEKDKIREGWNGDLNELMGLLGGPAPLADFYHEWPDLRQIDRPNTFKIGLYFPGNDFAVSSACRTDVNGIPRCPSFTFVGFSIQDSAYVFYPDPTIGGLILLPTFHVGQAFSLAGISEVGDPCGKVTYASTMLDLDGNRTAWTNAKMNQVSGCVSMIGSAASGCLPGGGCSGGGCSCAGGGCSGGCPPGACPFGSCDMVPSRGFEIGLNLHALFIPFILIVALRRRGLRGRK